MENTIQANPKVIDTTIPMTIAQLKNGRTTFKDVYGVQMTVVNTLPDYSLIRVRFGGQTESFTLDEFKLLISDHKEFN